MTDPGIAARDIIQSVVIDGSDNNVTLRFGDDLVIPLTRYQRGVPDRRRHQTGGDRPRVLDILNANRSPIQLLGRDEILADLEGWLTGDGDLSVHCLIGPAGTGKTRLAIELCRRMDNNADPGEWIAGFISPAELNASADDLAAKDYEWSKSSLLVIDYAAQAHEAIGKWLDRLAKREHQVKLRILLLEREAPDGFGWWASLTGTALNAQAPRRELFRDAEPRPQRLPGLTDVSVRHAVVTAAFAAAQKLLGTDNRPVPAFGSDPEFDGHLED